MRLLAPDFIHDHYEIYSQKELNARSFPHDKTSTFITTKTFLLNEIFEGRQRQNFVLMRCQSSFARD